MVDNNKNDPAYERVCEELEGLSEKIARLSGFLYGLKIVKSDISRQMEYKLGQQLSAMMEYANCLKERIRIWGLTTEEVNNLKYGE